MVYFCVRPVCLILFQPTDLLGAELLECLYWRKGALLYMYCHTAKERSEWLQENVATFKKVKDMKMFYELVNTALRFDWSFLKCGCVFCSVFFFSLIRILGLHRKYFCISLI